MTVNYADCSFKRLLFKWKGSIWKSIWKEVLVWLVIYFIINFIYRFAMPEYMQMDFRAVVHFVSKWTSFFPLQFLLGFFVNYIVGRWWDQLLNIAWPDKFLSYLTGNLPGNDHETKVVRRTIVRWVLLHLTLVWKEISVKIKKRFPSDEHLLKVGLFTEDEFKLYNEIPSMHGRWFAPVSWIINQLSDLRREGKISDMGLQTLIGEIYAFKSANGMLTIYDWINAPLRYTQVITFATYGYFFICLIARQTVMRSVGDLDADGKIDEIDLFFPLITVFEFIFYVGWLKVAEEYRVPFGEDDDDFDMNYILDRNVYVANLLVDDLAAQKPKPVVDSFFYNHEPILPHTKASDPVRDHIPDWRLAHFRIPPEKCAFLYQKMKEHNVEIPDDVPNGLPGTGQSKDDKAQTQDDINIRTGSRRNSFEEDDGNQKMANTEHDHVILGRLAPAKPKSRQPELVDAKKVDVKTAAENSRKSLDDREITSAPIINSDDLGGCQ